MQISDYVDTVGRVIQPADPLPSGSSRLKRRLRPRLAALQVVEILFGISDALHAFAF